MRLGIILIFLSVASLLCARPSMAEEISGPRPSPSAPAAGAALSNGAAPVPQNDAESSLAELIGKSVLPASSDLWRANSLKLLGADPILRFFIYQDNACEKNSYDFFLLKKGSTTYTITKNCDGSCVWKSQQTPSRHLSDYFCDALYGGRVPYRDYNGF